MDVRVFKDHLCRKGWIGLDFVKEIQVIFAVLLCRCFLIPSFSVYFHFFFPFLTRSLTEAVGDCPHATVFILKPFLCPLLKAVFPWRGHREEPSFLYTHPLLTSHFPFCLPAASCAPPHPCPPPPPPLFAVLLPISLFYFHVEQLPAVEAYITQTLHTARKQSQNDWRKKG